MWQFYFSSNYFAICVCVPKSCAQASVAPFSNSCTHCSLYTQFYIDQVGKKLTHIIYKDMS
jgi:hypothetical protein